MGKGGGGGFGGRNTPGHLMLWKLDRLYPVEPVGQNADLICLTMTNVNCT